MGARTPPAHLTLLLLGLGMRAPHPRPWLRTQSPPGPWLHLRGGGCEGGNRKSSAAAAHTRALAFNPAGVGPHTTRARNTTHRTAPAALSTGPPQARRWLLAYARSGGRARCPARPCCPGSGAALAQAAAALHHPWPQPPRLLRLAPPPWQLRWGGAAMRAWGAAYALCLPPPPCYQLLPLLHMPVLLGVSAS